MNQELLEQLYKLLRSYNPKMPMGPGMAAQFKEIMEKLEEHQQSVQESADAEIEAIKRLSGIGTILEYRNEDEYYSSFATEEEEADHERKVLQALWKRFVADVQEYGEDDIGSFEDYRATYENSLTGKELKNAFNYNHAPGASNPNYFDDNGIPDNDANDTVEDDSKLPPEMDSDIASSKWQDYRNI